MIPHVLGHLKADKPILIVGKGPTATKFQPDMLDKYVVVGINQAAAFCKAHIAFFIDYEPFIDTDLQYQTLEHVVMPWVIHWRERPDSGPLSTYLKFDPRLRGLYVLNKLLSYDLRTTEVRNYPERPVVQAFNSTTEAAIHTFALLGYKEIFTLGIDGGHSKASPFGEAYRTNDVAYDGQFQHIQKLSEEYKISIKPL